MRKTYTKTIKIISTKEHPVAIEILADHIQKIAAAMKSLNDGPVKMRAIILLLKDTTGLNYTDIENVLTAVIELPKRFLK